MSRPIVHIRVSIVRFLQAIGRYLDLYASSPLPQRPAFKRNIPSTVGDVPGNIELLFYTPPGYKLPKPGEVPSRRYPLLVNFHGGGYTIGSASDDARFLSTIQSQTPHLAVSVSYRLAPSYPFPTGIADCVSSLLYLWKNADSLGIDPQNTILSGFSAGAAFCHSSLYLLHSHLRTLRQQDSHSVAEIEKSGRVVGICTFYTPTNWTISRAERVASNPKFQPIGAPDFLFGVFEEAYLYPKNRLNMRDPLLSPGLASKELVREALPENICMITCELDGLLGEAEAWRERLREEGKRIEGYVVKDVPHGWDKWPSLWWGNERRDEAYRYAAEKCREFWG